ncbi:winged helix-turn-helix transcriptional regulator [Marinifilum sp. D737]|uniref:winged helix-turn-helix transcriptional regulator n=1 Tax=Marinifilum sp. D737 TaxID=2969628 RepID=UPI0022768886|nr:winged helix-turn-helix transcriptional regulator [Marinifilum sp. D737]
MVSREVYPEVPPKVVYGLTEAGKSIIPIIMKLDQWGQNFAKENHLYAPGE